jgi:hypothetical protein
MTEENKNGVFKPEKLSIIAFHITKGEIDVPFEFEQSQIIDFSTDMVFDLSFDYDNKLLRADIEFDIITECKENYDLTAKANFHFVYVYELENYDELIETENNKIQSINDSLMPAVAAISFSTSRGILMTRMQGTAMKAYMLPIVDPRNLIKSD